MSDKHRLHYIFRSEPVQSRGLMLIDYTTITFIYNKNTATCNYLPEEIITLQQQG